MGRLTLLMQLMVREHYQSRERSDPLNSYLLLSGSLTKEKLAEKLGDLGYKAIADRKIPPYFLAFQILLNPLILISLAIFGLSFFALVIITRIKEMRVAGIKLFSGQTLLSIMGHSLLISNGSFYQPSFPS